MLDVRSLSLWSFIAISVLADVSAPRDAYAAAPTIQAFNVFSGSPMNEPGGTVAFTCTIADADAGEPHLLIVDWGDGTAPETIHLGTSTNFAIGHAYAGLLPGQYAVQAVVVDQNSGFGTGSTTVTVADVALSLTMSVSGPSITESDRIGLRCSLSGGQAVPPVSTSVTGKATLLLDLSRNEFGLDVAVAGLAAGAQISSVTLRAGEPGENGVVLYTQTVPGGAVATGSAGTAVPAGTRAISLRGVPNPGFTASGRYSIRVTTTAGAAIEGTFKAALTIEGQFAGANEVPPTASSSSGRVTIVADRSTSDCDVLLDAQDLPAATAVQLRDGAAGVNGPILVDLLATGFVTATAPSGSHLSTQGTALTAGQVTKLLAGGLYVNVNTSDFPSGAIRAQLDQFKTCDVRVDIADPGVAQPFAASIDFGDDSEPTAITVPAGSTTVYAAHLYRDDSSPLSVSATKSISCRVTDTFGAAASASKSITVINSPPVLLPATVTPDFNGVRLQWYDAGSDSFTGTVTYDGNPGGYSFSTAAGVTQFDLPLSLAPGDHTIHVTIDDGDGGTASADLTTAVHTIALASPAFTAQENAGSAKVTVRLSEAAAADVSVGFETSDGTAKAGRDYTAVSQRLVIPAGATEAVVTIPLVDDSLVEGDEMFFVRLSAPSGSYALGTFSTAPVLICDDELRRCADLAIGASAKRKPLGLKRFGTDGVKQTLVQKVKAGAKATFFVTVVNSGPIADSFRIVGDPAVQGFGAVYFDATSGDDVTANVTDAAPDKAPLFELGPGESRRVRLESAVDAAAARKSSTTFQVKVLRATCPDVVDLVRATVVVK